MYFGYLKHDVNNLIFKIKTSLQILQEYIGNSESEISKILNLSSDSIEKIENVLNRIFLINKIENNQFKFNHINVKKQKIKLSERTFIDIKRDVIIDEYLFNQVIAIVKELNIKEFSIDSNRAFIKAYIKNDIDKFNLDFIVFILKLFEIDTEVEIKVE